MIIIICSNNNNDKAIRNTNFEKNNDDGNENT